MIPSRQHRSQGRSSTVNKIFIYAILSMQFSFWFDRVQMAAIKWHVHVSDN